MFKKILFSSFCHFIGIPSRAKKFFFDISRKIPYVAKKINEEKLKIATEFNNNVVRRNKSVPYIQQLPTNGLSEQEVVDKVSKYLSIGKYDWKGGYVSGAVYYYSEELVNLLTKVYGLASYTNPLHVDIFPGICKMEAEVVKIAANLFNGSQEACGTLTSGGTESILMVCKAYRDYARAEKGIKYPEMILPRTAHPAFEKAAFYFGITVKYIEVDPVTTIVPLKAVKRAISRNTIMLVGSAPNFPYGTMDDIQSIASLGKKYNIPVHVDCCLGGFLAVFMEKAGYSFPPFDFRIPGVTSISADTHKYGFAPKGSSVVLYREPKFRHYQYCVTTDWPGGAYGSPTVSGSRAGGIIAACWATLMYFGLEGYIESTKKIIETTKYIENRLRMIKGIFIFGKPATSVIAIGSDKFHIYRLCEKLNDKGWNLNVLQFPPGTHLCVTHMHTAEGVADQFIRDVEKGVEDVLNEPNNQLDGGMAMYGMAQKLPDRAVVGDFTRLFLDAMYYIPKETYVKEDIINGHKM
ncbi:hypothetical protein AAG570_011617 [Ranatra chinensis]|uniref:sphinganine-1-phosphate aldolase n=1 Tax=Ranatra chinensis TaxID=642074 RepID=A0ABD0YZD2_9HEMI